MHGQANRKFYIFEMIMLFWVVGRSDFGSKHDYVFIVNGTRMEIYSTTFLYLSTTKETFQ